MRKFYSRSLTKRLRAMIFFFLHYPICAERISLMAVHTATKKDSQNKCTVTMKCEDRGLTLLRSFVTLRSLMSQGFSGEVNVFC